MSAARVLLTTGAFVFLAVSMTTACDEEVIVLAALPPYNNGGSGHPGTGIRCINTTECADGFFCERFSCTDAAGTCEPYPVSCPQEEHPVCGCDGVTYFNDCLRRSSGIGGSSPEECGATGTLCGGPSNTACPDGAVCALLTGGRSGCRPDATGRCWVLPSTCPRMAVAPIAGIPATKGRTRFAASTRAKRSSRATRSTSSSVALHDASD